MRRGVLFICGMYWVLIGSAQVDESSREEFDAITSEWLQRSELLGDYAGISAYCQSADFRKSVNQVIETVHHYDSLIIHKLEDPVLALSMDHRAQEKTYKDILKLESQYSTKDFVRHMRETCAFRKDIERDADRLKNSMGTESYDAKILVLEIETGRYLRNIDKLVTKVDEHLHYLYILE